MNKLILIDGNSLINRAFYATPLLTDKSGQPTNAVLGFVNMLVKVIKEETPSYIIVAFDRKEPTFRHLVYAEYKGTRKPMPNELATQIPLLKSVLAKMNITCFEKPSIEADDIIGTFAKRHETENIIITGDKDSLQLVDEYTKVYFTRRGISDVEIYTNENFKEKTGITPPQITDLKACMGDSSDNILGIPGVGEKTALTLVSKYGIIDNIYENLNDFSGKTLEKIVNGKESCFLSKKLATIKTDVEISINIQDATYDFPFNKEVKKLFTDLDFRNILKRTELFEENTETEILEENQIKSELFPVNNLEDLNEIKNSSVISCSLLNGFNVTNGNGKEFFVKQKETFFDEGVEITDAVEYLKEYFEDPSKTVITYSRKKLSNFLYSMNITLKAYTDDVDIERYLADFSGKEETEKDTLNYYNLSEQTSATSLYILNEKFKKIIETEDLISLYKDVELNLSAVLTDMERKGFKVDITVLNAMGEKFKKDLDGILEKIYSLTGITFNPNSPKQLGEVLFEKLGLKKGKKNKNGGYSTSAEILEEIENEHPVVPLVLEYRAVQKLYSTYIEGLKPLIDKKTGLVHTCFNQTLTQTGRLSSKEPNLQNIPVRDEMGKELRKMFVPRDSEHILIDADYSQIELRLLAHFSGSKELIDAYNQNKDIHTLTASQVFGVKVEEVTSKMRREAKAVNFGIIYGISEYGLAKNLKIKPIEAKNYIEKYFETYPSVKEYMNKNVEFAKANGYVTSLLKRKRVIPEINSSNYNLRSFGERAAMNMPLQGTSADIIKIAMINVYKRLKEECKNSYLIMQVHDELIIDASKQEVEKAKNILVEEMENAVKLSVPLTVEASIGESWFEAK